MANLLLAVKLAVIEVISSSETEMDGRSWLWLQIDHRFFILYTGELGQWRSEARNKQLIGSSKLSSPVI